MEKKPLLLLLALLVVVKFVIYPVIDWQESTLDELKSANARLVKSSSVIENEDKLNDALSAVEAHQNVLERLISPYAEEAEFRFITQKLLSDMIDEYGMDTENIGWLSRLEITEAGLIRHQVRVVVDGKTTEVQKFVSELESNRDNILIRQFQVSLRYQDSDSLGRARLSLLLAFYMNKPEATSA